MNSTASAPSLAETLTRSFAVGNPRFSDPATTRIAREEGNLAAWRHLFATRGRAAPEGVAGDFAVVLRDGDGRVFLAVDRFSIRTLCYRLDDGRILAAERADELAPPAADLDPQALYDYLYYHTIPAPRTVFKGVSRLPAGHCAVLAEGRFTLAPWWKPRFHETGSGTYASLKDEFRQLLTDAIREQVQAADGAVGCFLSGGTDSSTVAGVLQQVAGQPIDAFSIGFAASGYDEMDYARIAARHFGVRHHEYYVTPEDLVRSIPKVATFYDQPFGNSSVLPAYYCAEQAIAAGTKRMLAGDGGDELFGGNTRYVKQKVFGIYETVPPAVRRHVVEPLLASPILPNSIPLFRKAASYVDQARVPMPDRMHMYNLLLRIGQGEVLSAEFLEQVDAAAPEREQRDVYGACSASSLVNRMLQFDWKYTLADNDLPKVTGATALAGLPVGFPLLDDGIVDFSLRLAPELKIKGFTLRWFFKEALRDFLPPAILSKKKHGFGLPFGVWAVEHPELRRLAMESLESLRDGDIVRSDFLDRLMKEYLPQHPAYYGELVWILMMLAQWLAQHRSRRPQPAALV